MFQPGSTLSCFRQWGFSKCRAILISDTRKLELYIEKLAFYNFLLRHYVASWKKNESSTQDTAYIHCYRSPVWISHGSHSHHCSSDLIASFDSPLLLPVSIFVTRIWTTILSVCKNSDLQWLLAIARHTHMNFLSSYLLCAEWQLLFKKKFEK